MHILNSFVYFNFTTLKKDLCPINMVGTNILLSKLSRNRVVCSQSIISLSFLQHSVSGTVSCASWTSTHSPHPLLKNYFSGTQFLPVKSLCSSELKWNTEFNYILFSYIHQNKVYNILNTSRLFGAGTTTTTKTEIAFLPNAFSTIKIIFKYAKYTFMLRSHSLFIQEREDLALRGNIIKEKGMGIACQISGPSMR